MGVRLKRFVEIGILVLGNLWELVKWPLGIFAGILLYAIIATWIVDGLHPKDSGFDKYDDPCPNGCSDPR